MTEFTDLSLAAPLVEAIAAKGYSRPTPIQIQAIPHVLARRDLLGIAQTGTGKTAAFALPILDRLAANPGPTPRRGTRVLVLAPTRELASQIADSFRDYGRFLKLTVATVFGGVPINRHLRQMERGTDVLVATPGRLIDLIDRKALGLGHVEVLVLDEADQMLDLGFIHALRRIVPLLPRRRQTLLFSATMPAAIAELAARYLTDPAEVSVAPAATTVEKVDQTVRHMPASDKQAALAEILRDPALKRTLVFARTKHGADRVVRKLAQDGIDAAAIHGNKSQPQRERALAAFRSGRTRVLVATDIAARGVDVPGVDLVVNFEMPNVPEQYVHRIGRTARAGATGRAVSLVAEDERPFLRDIEKLTRRPLAVEGKAPPAPAAAAKPAPEARNRRRRRRPAGGPAAPHKPAGRHAATRG